MSYKVIDISKHQYTFDAAQAKRMGIDTVICRCAYGASRDSKWNNFAPAVTSEGLNLGSYGFLTAHYKQLNSGVFQSARKIMHGQVAAWINILKEQKVTSWVAVDEELESGYSMALDKADNTALLNEACDLLEAAGFHACVYSGASWAMTYIDENVLRHPLWIAYYYSDPQDPDFAGCADITTVNTKYGRYMTGLGDKLVMWQFGRIGYGSTYGAGSANLDKNIMYRKPLEEDNMSDYSFDTYKIGPVSYGDRKAMAAFADGLSLKHFDEGDYIVIGPMSGGDRKSVISQAQYLGLGVEGYVPDNAEDVAYAEFYKVGPVSGGDRKSIAKFAEDLGVDSYDDGDCLIVGPIADALTALEIADKVTSLVVGIEAFEPVENDKPVEEPDVVPPAISEPEIDQPPVEEPLPVPDDNYDPAPEISLADVVCLARDIVLEGCAESWERNMALSKLEEFELWVSRSLNK